MEPIHLRQRCDVTECVAKAIHRALNKDLDERFPTVSAFAEALLRDRLDLLDRFRGNATGRVSLSIQPSDDVRRPAPSTMGAIEPLPTAAPASAPTTGVGLIVAAVAVTALLAMGLLVAGAAGGLFLASKPTSEVPASVTSEPPASPSAAAVPQEVSPDLPTEPASPDVPAPVEPVAPQAAPIPEPAPAQAQPQPALPAPEELSVEGPEAPTDAVAEVIEPAPAEVTVTEIAPRPPEPVAPTLTGEWSGKAGGQRMSLKLVSAGTDLSGSLVLYVGTQVRTEPLRGTVGTDGSVRFTAGDLAFVGKGDPAAMSGTYMREGAKKSVEWSASR
jgi:hypothetical protein